MVNGLDGTGRNSLWLAAAQGHSAIVSLLLEHGAKNQKDCNEVRDKIMKTQLCGMVLRRDFDSPTGVCLSFLIKFRFKTENVCPKIIFFLGEKFKVDAIEAAMHYGHMTVATDMARNRQV